jgi:hypothetical protein
VKLFWAAIWIAILNALALLGGFVLLVVPAILLAIWFTFTSYVLVLEDKRGMSALLASKEYVKGFWWAIVGRILLLALVWFAILLIIYAPLAAIFGGIFGGILYVLLFLVFVPFSVCYTFEIFTNLRRLKPEVEGSVMKAGRDFLKVCFVIGALAAVALIALGAFGAVLGMRGEMNPSTGFYPGYPMIPASGTVPIAPLAVPLNNNT